MIIKSGYHQVYQIQKKYFLIIVFSFYISCTAPFDYFGNNVDIQKDRIFLNLIREDKNEKDKYILIFVEQRGNPTKKSNRKKKKTLNRYIDLIMSYYGYTENIILEERTRGFIEPRYYVTVQFN